MNVSAEYGEGVMAFMSGHSVYYNPYRDRGTDQQFSDWLAGYLMAKWESECV